MPKRKCVFTESLIAEYPFLKEDQQVGKVLYFICKSQFPTESMEAVPTNCNIPRKENTHLLQKLRVAVKK
jgi:hypothetical protein